MRSLRAIRTLPQAHQDRAAFTRHASFHSGSYTFPAAAGDSKADSRYTLKFADHRKQIIRARISLGTKHAHQALGRRARRLRRLLKSHGRADIVSENRFTDFNLASNESLHGVGQKRLRGIALGAGIYGLLKVSGQCHRFCQPELPVRCCTIHAPAISTDWESVIAAIARRYKPIQNSR